MVRNRVNISVIGHLDHGKSTLIGRLLYDTKTISRETIEGIVKMRGQKKNLDFSLFLDSFKEERQGQFTLDTTQAIVKTKSCEYNFIDCPGHKEFIQNMLTGASQAKCTILVVSAKKNEGIKEQTKMHINLAKLLGIEKVITVVNKMDTVNYKKERFLDLKGKLEDYLKTIGYRKKIFFIPVSSKSGENIMEKSSFMNWHKGKSLLGVLNGEIRDLNYANKKAGRPLRLFVQDVYSEGSKRILFGKIETGVLKVDDKIFMNLSFQRGVVKEIMASDKSRKVSQKEGCVSFIVEGVNLEKVKRGEVVTNSYPRPRLVKKFKADVFFFKRMGKNNPTFLIKFGLREAKCRMELLTLKDRIYKTDVFLDAPLLIENSRQTPSLGRFILLDRKKNITGFGKVNV